MSKIPFKVSARTARLIGRENIASSKGAIIELVKNAYDADSELCLIYFDNKYSELPDKLVEEDFKNFDSIAVSREDIDRLYPSESGGKLCICEEDEQFAKDFLSRISKLNSLYIVDFGDGMNSQIIRDNWMVIGTDSKASDIFTSGGRIKSGAKGIGRFALDKLGNLATMTTVFDKNVLSQDLDEKGVETGNDGYIWNVRWSDFEGEFKTIDRVYADLSAINGKDIFELIDEELPKDLISSSRKKKL
ncbi:ATP-binding protein [Coraliomargarita sp. SDUM461003]|uniref:ATP-binding protein n=1 Tax=Thalassobacterium maritimum TaxID=3041265 RepID=A0ABU1AP54_9BACT|nr:ATP-binding protein [Coraliomargarita sp. SDUM461003]MDQ8205903.1 ATP-binding protein [Coraliomargarita sp. SDUM461003]